MKIKVGCDPELFVKRNGHLVNAHGLVQGTKQKPFPVNRGAVQVDGMALEFNIDPASTRAQFVTNVQTVMEQLQNMVPGYNLLPEPAVVFPKAFFDKQPAASKEMGCDPDYNAYTGDANSPPDAESSMRTASGHIHIGWTEGRDPNGSAHYSDCMAVARQLDYYLGVYSMLWDGDGRRRSMYGKAGAFRPKPYGVEYRVMSNAWLRNPELMGWVYDATVKGVTDLLEYRMSDGVRGTDMFNAYGETAQHWIDNNETRWIQSNPMWAKDICHATALPLPPKAA